LRRRFRAIGRRRARGLLRRRVAVRERFIADGSRVQRVGDFPSPAISGRGFSLVNHLRRHFRPICRVRIEREAVLLFETGGVRDSPPAAGKSMIAVELAHDFHHTVDGEDWPPT